MKNKVYTIAEYSEQPKVLFITEQQCSSRKTYTIYIMGERGRVQLNTAIYLRFAQLRKG